jgi:UDP-N-acetylmuramyl tripeptide synthase
MKIILLTILAKTISFVSKKIFKRAGETWPGEILLRIYPNVLELSRKFIDETIVITGTNGKTTTAKLTTELFEKKGYSVIKNTSGANMINGVVSCIFTQKKIIDNKKYIAVFEIDEYSVENITKFINPSVIIFLNIFRDQLDRYGEVENILSSWKKVINKSPNSKIIVNSADPGLFEIASKHNEKLTYYYSVPKLFLTDSKEIHGDKIYCYNCNSRLKYNGVYVSHMGDWSCDNCQIKPKKSYVFPTEILEKYKVLPDYVLINTQAIMLLAKLSKFKEKDLYAVLDNFKPAFGRGEEFSDQNHVYKFYLGKNPSSWTVALSNMNLESNVIVFGLNNKIPDGHDISWIYDIRIKQKLNKKNIYIYGDRAYDMALRFKMEGIKKVRVFESLSELIIDLKNNKNFNVSILANYSAMLEARKQIMGKAIL